MFATVMKSIILQKVVVWLRVGWPLAKGIVEVMKDGVVTKAEMYEVIDTAMTGRTEVRLWGKK